MVEDQSVTNRGPFKNSEHSIPTYISISNVLLVNSCTLGKTNTQDDQ